MSKEKLSGKVENQFILFYEQYCRNYKLKSKVRLLNNKQLKLDADRLSNDDWTPIIQALKLYGTDLHSLEINSVYHMNKLQRSRNLNNNNCKPAFLVEPLLKILIETLIYVINNSDILSSISLQGFSISCYMESLTESIKIQRRLQHLALPYCELNAENLKCLCKAVAMHTGLQLINLTGCDITSNMTQLIADMIRAQKLVRYGETWKQSLRYRLPEPDIVPGLRRLVLNDNPKIGDEGFKIIAHELIDDLWIKAVDLQNCGLTEKSSTTAIDLVKTNPILMIVDVRRNDLSDKVLSIIMSQLHKDVGNNYCGITYEWINSTINSSTSTHTSQVLPRNVQSSPNIKTSTNPLKSLNLSNKAPCKSNSNDILGELERTKNLLQKVSCKLYEEKSKRETLEKQQKELKSQLERIRTYILEHDRTGFTHNSSNCSSPIKGSDKRMPANRRVASHKTVKRSNKKK